MSPQLSSPCVLTLVPQPIDGVLGGVTDDPWTYGEHNFADTDLGVQVQVYAIAFPGYRFSRWEIAGSETGVFADNPHLFTILPGYVYIANVFFEEIHGPQPPIPNSGQGYLHVNPIQETANPDGSVTFTPETCVSYPEGSPEFDYIMSLIGLWDYYTSPSVVIPDTNAVTSVDVVDFDAADSGQNSGGISAYIYGWMPGSPNWMPGMCTAFVFIPTPTVTVAGISKTCTLHNVITGNINFDGTASMNVVITG